MFHLVGQSNAEGRARGTLSFPNSIGMRLPNGSLLPNYVRWTGVHGVDAVLAGNWPDSRQVVVVETTVGGISVQEWIDQEWINHLQKIDNLPLPPNVKHVVLWVQGEADTHDATEAGQAYIDSTTLLYDLFENRLGDVRIVDVRLNPDRYRGGPPDPRAGFAIVVNESKATAALGRDNVVLIGGTYEIGNDNAHYTQIGLEAMAAEFLETIEGF